MKTIFVSSTFRDMQFERDAIRELTAPRVNAEAHRYNDAVEFCDLRWGIDTSELESDESGRKVLDVCLDEIDRSDPPMVVILGYRYGWIPPQTLIRTAAERKQLELEEPERSITALEIEYGALSDPAKAARTLFYFREIENDAPAEYQAEDAEHAQRMKALKDRIRAVAGDRVKTYTVRWNGQGFDGVREFAGTVAADIADLLRPGWESEAALTPFDRERRTHESFIHEKAALFRARKTDAEKLFALAQTQKVTVVRGAVGSGKSTLFSHLAERLSQTEWTVLPFISGLTENAHNVGEVVESAVFWLELRLGEEEHFADETDPETQEKKKHDLNDWLKRLSELCAAFTAKGEKLFVMLDAADQLDKPAYDPSDRFYVDSLDSLLSFFMRTAAENVHFLMTCTPELALPDALPYTLAPITEADKRAVIAAALPAGRELSAPVIAAMLQMKASDNPLYLSLLVQRLRMMDRDDYEASHSAADGMRAIEAMQLRLISAACPDGLDEMSAALLKEAGARINPALTQRAAELLAASRYGLRRHELADLLGEIWSEADFAHLMNYMSDCFLMRKDGRLDFMHKSIRAGFLKQTKDLTETYRTLLSYFVSQNVDDPDLYYYAIRADDKAFFLQNMERKRETESFLERIGGYYHYYRKIILMVPAKALVEYSLTDGGAWAISLLKSVNETQSVYRLLDFFCEAYWNYTTAYFYENTNCIPWDKTGAEQIYKTVFSLAKELCEKNLEQEDKYKYPKQYRELLDKSRKDLLTLYLYLGNQIKKSGNDKENMKQAIKYYSEGLEYVDLQLSTNVINETQMTLYECIGEAYAEMGDKEDLYHAIDVYTEASNLCKRDIRAALFEHRIAEIYEKMGGKDNLRHALDHYSHLGKIVEKNGTILSREVFISSWAGVKQDYLQRSLRIMEQLALDQNDPENEEKYLIVYHGLGDAFKTIGENLLQSAEYYKKELEIRERLVLKQATPETRRELADGYNNIAEVYQKLGGTENLNTAKEYLTKGLMIRVQLAFSQNDAQAKLELSENYVRLGDILTAKGEALQAHDYYYKPHTVLEQLPAEQRSEQVLRSLISSYDKLGASYDALGGKGNLKQAQACYIREVNVFFELLKILYFSASDWDECINCLKKVAGHPASDAATKEKYLSYAIDAVKAKYRSVLEWESSVFEEDRKEAEAILEELNKELQQVQKEKQTRSRKKLFGKKA